MNTHLTRLGRVVFITFAVCSLAACNNVLGYINTQQMARNVTSWKAEMPLLDAMLKNCEDQVRAGQRDAADLRQCRAAYTARYRKAQKDVAAGEFYRACLAEVSRLTKEEGDIIEAAELQDATELVLWYGRTRDREEACVAALTAARGEAQAEYEAAGSPDFPLGAELREVREQAKAEVLAEYELCTREAYKLSDYRPALDECEVNRDRDLRNVEALISSRSPTVSAGLSPLSSDTTPSTAAAHHGPVTPPGSQPCPGKPNVFIPLNAPIGICNSL